MSNTANGNGARSRTPARAEPRYVLMDLSGEHYRIYSGLVRAEY